MKILMIVLLMFVGAISPGDSNRPTPLETVPAVDLSRYVGKWYEVARLPNRFQKNCVGDVTATYSLLKDKQIRVVNTCRQKNGRTIIAEGRARLADASGANSKLEVRFAPAWLSWLSAVWGDYWIIDLSPDYNYAVVGSPDRQYLWILARTPVLDESIYQQLVQRAAAKGFAVNRLVKSQPQ